MALEVCTCIRVRGELLQRNYLSCKKLQVPLWTGITGVQMFSIASKHFSTRNRKSSDGYILVSIISRRFWHSHVLLAACCDNTIADCMCIFYVISPHIEKFE